MKSLKLVFKNIKYYINSNKLVFSLFVAGIMSCTVLVIYLYGNYNSIKRIFHEDDRTYSFMFYEPIDFSEWDKYEDESLEGVINHAYSIRLHEINFNDELIEDNLGFGLSCAKSDKGTNNLILFSGRNYFTDEEIASGENVVIINESLYTYIERQLGKRVDYNSDTLIIEGIEYRIIGTTATGPNMVIPYLSYIHNIKRVESVSIALEVKPSYYDNLEFVKKVRSDNEDNLMYVYTPYSDYERVQKDTPLVLGLAAIIFAFVSMAFIVLVKYLSDETNHISVIHYICGATKKKVVLIKMMTVFFMTVFAGGLGILFHALTYRPLLSKLDIVEGLYYTFGEYMMILAVVCVAAVIVTVPFIIGFSKNSVILNKNKYR